ncbi:MAG TPA: hypothetical protein VNM89_03455, partial [Solirubrobacterales bacterium]|nr:hypothetical protein [Solirubrobacterales bacterium]
MSDSGQLIWAVLCAAIGALALAPAAGAAVTSSQIISPAGPSFAIADHDAPNTIAVSGTSNGGDLDRVDLNCFYDVGGVRRSARLAVDVDVDGSGSFSAPAANLANIEDRVCRLRAVPAGEDPPDLTPFSGPVMAIGERETIKVSGGPNGGVTTDYYIWGQQLTVGIEYASAGSCGISDSFLYDAGFDATTTTFACAGYWNRANAPLGQGTRSEVQADGANAYVPAGAASINSAASGLPPLAYSYGQNPLNGDLTIEESDPIVKCSSGAFPPDPSNCPAFSGTGVRLDRTIEQTEDGHLVTITDRFVSTDGQAHSLDLLTENDQQFGTGNGFDVAYRFPGEVSYSTHSEGDVVSFPDAEPGAVLIEVDGSPDGDPTTGRGAIVFDRPSSPATFNYVTSSVSEFYFHQTVNVPAGGSITVRLAYVQGYTQAEVDALVQQAKDAFAPTPSDPAASPPPSGSGLTGLGLRRARLNRRNGTAILPVAVPGAGRLVLTGGRKVKRLQRRSARAGVVNLTVTPKGQFAEKLERKGSLAVSVRVTFTSATGETGFVRRRLVLHMKRRAT